MKEISSFHRFYDGPLGLPCYEGWRFVEWTKPKDRRRIKREKRRARKAAAPHIAGEANG